LTRASASGTVSLRSRYTDICVFGSPRPPGRAPQHRSREGPLGSGSATGKGRCDAVPPGHRRTAAEHRARSRVRHRPSSTGSRELSLADGAEGPPHSPVRGALRQRAARAARFPRPSCPGWPDSVPGRSPPLHRQAAAQSPAGRAARPRRTTAERLDGDRGPQSRQVGRASRSRPHPRPPHPLRHASPCRPTGRGSRRPSPRSDVPTDDRNRRSPRSRRPSPRIALADDRNRRSPDDRNRPHPRPSPDPNPRDRRRPAPHQHFSLPPAHLLARRVGRTEGVPHLNQRSHVDRNPAFALGDRRGPPGDPGSNQSNLAGSRSRPQGGELTP